MARKKKFLIMPRNTRAQSQGVPTSKGVLSFKGKSAMYVSDAGLADEINKTVGLKIHL